MTVTTQERHPERGNAAPPRVARRSARSLILLAAGLALAACQPARATAVVSQAYGSINNFDTVNDTGTVCHGFEIEIDGIHSKDITYTYDWNHYGVPKITEDSTNPLNPKVFVRYQSAKNPDGTWAAYTAIPAAPIPPTAGHQFTNPSVNFGGEHFGVGFFGTPTAVTYSWLKDDGAGNLVFAGAVYISTPAFVYQPPVFNVPAQVQAVIVPPPPPAPPVKEFGVASWVKEIRTTSHNHNKVELRDLVDPDPADPNAKDWRNGEADEVEVEWQLFQTDFNQAGGGANGEIAGAPEEIPNGDEIVTRRYEFYKYVGPLDPETGEALADSVGPDGIHGQGVKTINGVETDLSTVVLVGDFVGAQMAGFDPAGQLGLIDHVQDGDANEPYVERTIVIGGTAPVETTLTGSLPDGMTFDTVTGVLSGTPTATGKFTFTVHSTDAANADVTKTYDLNVLAAAVPAHITTSASPVAGGTTSGDGDYASGAPVSVTATANPGYAFLNWTEAGAIVSSTASYDFAADVSRDLVANFVRTYAIATSASPSAGGVTSGGGTFNSGDSVTVTAAANAGYHFLNWTDAGTVVSSSASYTFAASADRALVANFSAVNDVSAQIAVARGGFRLNRATGRYVQTVTLTNKGAALNGPISLVLDSLSANATLANKTGVTGVQAPANSPYIDATSGGLAAGAHIAVTLEFTNPTNAGVTYSTRVLAGPGSR